MVRTLLAPKMLALHLALLGVLISFTLLGRWQLGVFEGSGSERLTAVARAPAAPISRIIEPGRRFGVDEVGRAVTATGVFEGRRQLLVPRSEGDYWVLTPLKTSSGVLPVVRGRVRGPGDANPEAPDARVTVAGRLQVDEDVRPASGLPPGQVGRVSTADLVNLWQGGPLYGGYLIAERGAGDLGRVAAAKPVERVGVEWRNLAYALQWWIFAAFAVFMWWHIIRDQHRKRGSK